MQSSQETKPVSNNPLIFAIPLPKTPDEMFEFAKGLLHNKEFQGKEILYYEINRFDNTQMTKSEVFLALLVTAKHYFQKAALNKHPVAGFYVPIASASIDCFLAGLNSKLLEKIEDSKAVRDEMKKLVEPRKKLKTEIAELKTKLDTEKTKVLKDWSHHKDKEALAAKATAEIKQVLDAKQAEAIQLAQVEIKLGVLGWRYSDLETRSSNELKFLSKNVTVKAIDVTSPKPSTMPTFHF